MMNKNSDGIERIGESVMASKERHREYILKMSPEWKKVGAKLRKARESLHISRQEAVSLLEPRFRCLSVWKMVSRFGEGAWWKRHIDQCCTLFQCSAEWKQV